MPTQSLPAINQAAATGWTETQRNLYNYMPFYLAQMQVDRRKVWTTWSKLCGKIKWTPNMGEVMKTVRKEPSPVIRQQAFPSEISAAAKTDIMDVREMSVTATVKHHKFESPYFPFYPSFRDFMKNHVEVHAQDIMQKQEIFEDMFLRAGIFHNSPYVGFPDRAGGFLMSSPHGNGNDAGTTGKTTAWLQAKLVEVGNPGNLSLTTINMAATIAANDLAIPPFSGANSNDNVSKSGLAEQYVLVTSAEAYNQFFFDPWLLAYKSVNLNVITDGFKGNLWGQVTCKLERFPLRIAADGTMPAPEIRVVVSNISGTDGNGTANEATPYNVNESIPNPDYVNAPYEVAFLVGSCGYDSIEVGPPPKAFANSGMPEGFGKMQWNGEVILSKNIVIPAKDADGNTIYISNEYGEFIHFISKVTYGLLPRQRRNIIPIIFKRRRGA